jgi:Ca2+-transporting ATPase
MAELLRAFGARSTARTIWHLGVCSNRSLVLVVLASFALQVAIHALPSLHVLFATSSIAPRQWGAWLALGAVPLLVLEGWKVVRQRRRTNGDNVMPGGER